jgi:hypothetical protein
VLNVEDRTTGGAIRLFLACAQLKVSGRAFCSSLEF